MIVSYRRQVVIGVGIVVLLGMGIFVGIQSESTLLKEKRGGASHSLLQEDGASEADEAAKLGQLFLVGIPGTQVDPRTKELLERVKPGGVVLYARNLEDREQTTRLTQELQVVAKKSTGAPYFIMLDEEPEGATRLYLLQGVFSLGLPNWNSIESGVQALADTGVTVELAPLADFPFVEEAFVKRRVPVETEEELMAFNREFIAILHERGVLSTLKHFPGMGVFAKDPHDGLPSAAVGQDFLDRSLAVFRDGIDNGADFVMTGHAIYENIDSSNPATFSSAIVTGMLQEQLGFTGLAITDDLSDMPLAAEGEISDIDSAVRALHAGHHMVMFSHRLEDTARVFEGVLERVKQDPELQALVEKNYETIMEFKQERLHGTGE